MTKLLTQRHDYETKIRLTQAHHELLVALARMRDLPTAVLARQLVVAHLERWSGSDSVPSLRPNGRPAQTLPT